MDKNSPDRVFVDVRNNEFNYESTTRLNRVVDLRESGPRLHKKWIRSGLLIVGVFLGIAASLYFWVWTAFADVRESWARHGADILNNFSEAVQGLGRLELDQAENRLKINERLIIGWQASLARNHNNDAASFIASGLPFLKDFKIIIGGVAEINKELLNIKETLADLETNFIYYLQFDGPALITRLTSLANGVEQVAEYNNAVKKLAGRLSDWLPFFDGLDRRVSANYISLSVDIASLKNTLDGFLQILNAEGNRHILVLFENEGEIRPGGGFLTAYADLTFRGGQIVNLEIEDMAVPDASSSLKIIPPLAMRTVERRWRVKDANWFFDFRDSAEKTLSLMEKATLFAARQITFDGAMAVNSRILENILAVAGPIDLEGQNKLTADNIFFEIKKMVEAARKKKSADPKLIIKTLAPLVIKKINDLPEAERKDLQRKIIVQFQNKNAALYFRNRSLAGFINRLGIDRALPEPEKGWANYLALANANLGGGKSDKFVTQRVEWRVDIDSTGLALNDVVVNRKNGANIAKDVWFRSENKNFFQLFAPANTSLISLQVNSPAMNGINGLDYDSGYVSDPFLADLEAVSVFIPEMRLWKGTYRGYAAYGTWFSVPLGAEKTLRFRYEEAPPQNFNLEENSVYRLVFDPQGGVSAPLKIKVAAPLGYVWRESQETTFVYDSEEPPGRVIIELTLIKKK